MTTFPVLVRSDVSLARSKDTVRCMEAVSRGNLAAVVVRNLSMTRSLCAVDALLLMLRVREVWNFEWWEHLVAAEEVPVQDPGEDTGGKGSITQWVHAEYMEGSETIHPTFTQWVRGGYFSKVPTKVPTR